MKRLIFWALVFAVVWVPVFPGMGQDGAAPSAPARSASDLDTMLGPIALYPDPLIGQMLAAATQPSQIVMADRYVQGGGDPNAIDQQPWDASVKALARYPSVLKWMDDNIAWTTAVGEAFASQQADVMASIQRLRAKAQALGNLQTTPQQQVVAENGQIGIVPADPDTLYVPYYDPAEVYFEAAPAAGWITFGVGLPIGLWLNGDFDWGRGRFFYWSHDHPRPHDWWHLPPGRRPLPAFGNHGATVWRPGHGLTRGVSGREDRGFAAGEPGREGFRPSSPAPRIQGETGRESARPAPSSRPAERSVSRPAPSRASGALVGVQNSRETHESSARGAASRGGGGGGGGGGGHGGGGRR
jgi:hypothetical protein